MKFLALIPARFASTRFPGKPLVDIMGKQMVHHVYDRASELFEHCYVATDDSRIENAVQAFGGKVVMTSENHKSGTDRCHEALETVERATGLKFDVIINIQGDEPFIATEQLKQIAECFNDPTTDIATLVKPFSADEDIFDANKPKVVVTANSFAIYFSRSVIPYLRGVDKSEWQTTHQYLKHIGLYAYRADVLREITSIPQTPLEIAESLEQLRWIENGYKIKVSVTDKESYSIDTPEDLQNFLSKNC